MIPRKDTEFWLVVLWLVLFAAFMWVMAAPKANAQEQYKPVVPFSKTSWVIEPYYEFKPVVAAFTVKPKVRDYCPKESDDYQCPSDYEPIKYFDDSERVRKKRKICPSWDFEKRKCRKK